MAEVIVDKIACGILHVEILISLGHRICLWDMGNRMKTFQNLAGLVYQNKSVIVYLRPLRGDAMQIPSFRKALELARFSIRKELTAHRIWRDNNLGFLIML